MNIIRCITAEEFIEELPELPEIGDLLDAIAESADVPSHVTDDEVRKAQADFSEHNHPQALQLAYEFMVTHRIDAIIM